MREGDGNRKKDSLLSGVPQGARPSHILLAKCVANPSSPELLSSLVLIQASSEAQAQSHTSTSALPHTQAHTPRHMPRDVTHARTHMQLHTPCHAPHRHTYAYACTHVHILTLIYKCTLTRGQSKKNYYSSERNRLPSPLSASRTWAEMRWAQSILKGPGP